MFWYIVMAIMALIAAALFGSLIYAVRKGPNVGGEEEVDCPACNGHGYLIIPDGPGEHASPVQKVCQRCNGSGIFKRSAVWSASLHRRH